MRVFVFIICVYCVKFISFFVIVEIYVCVYFNGEIYDVGKNFGEKKSEKIEIFVREEIKNYLYDYVNKIVLLKNNS